MTHITWLQLDVEVRPKPRSALVMGGKCMVACIYHIYALHLEVGLVVLDRCCMCLQIVAKHVLHSCPRL